MGWDGMDEGRGMGCVREKQASERRERDQLGTGEEGRREEGKKGGSI